MAKTIPLHTNSPLISIVILNWNGLEDTLVCLDSVEKLNYDNYEVVVVDNGSEGSIEPLEKRASNTIKVVKNEVNRGFAGGEVSALPHCNGEYILLLNNDATIDPEAINAALKTFSTDMKIAVVGSRSYSIDEDSEASRGFYSFQRVDPVTAEVATYKNDNRKAEDSVTVSGSGVMIKKDAIDRYGYFDERFFAYYEETDLFARYLRAGLRVVYDPTFKIWHKDGASTRNKRFMYYYLMLKNQFLFAYKNFDKDYLKEFKKTYFRNFRRSLWLYLKERGNTEAIHKARVRSTVWNLVYLFGTKASRRKTQAINRVFSYNSLLVSAQPLTMSVVIDGTKSPEAEVLKSITTLLSLNSVPSEIVVVTTKPVSIPAHSHVVTVQNLVDKKIFDLQARDFGFMCSNTDLLINLTPEQINAIESSQLSEDLVSTYRSMISNEAALAINTTLSTETDLKLTNNSKAALIAVKKSDLVNFIDINKNIYSLTEDIWGRYINWCVMECKPIARIRAHELLSTNTRTPAPDYPILSSPVKWHLKKAVRALHLSRILAKLKKMIKGSISNEATDIKAGSVKLDTTPEQALQTPIIINTRDRVDPLKELTQWLAEAGYKRIAFIDNDSTYPELIDFFNDTPYQVITLGRNGMHKAPWQSFAVRFLAKNAPYVITDPDILPAKDTPSDSIQHFYSLLDKYPAYNKVGAALKIDDLPDHYAMKKSVIEWESRFWDESLLLEKDVYGADLDTTFALYRGGTDWFLSPSIRVGGKYAMHHEPWYQDLDNPTDDMMYYRTRASHEVSTWTKGKLPKHHLRALKKEGLL